MECGTQLLYGTSGPTRVNEDASCRATDTCALQGYVQMCMRSTLSSGDRHATGIPTKSAEETNLGSYSIPTELMSLSHFQFSQYVWSRNQGRVTSSHAADSFTFAERERVRNSKSRPPSIIHRSCERCSQTQ